MRAQNPDPPAPDWEAPAAEVTVDGRRYRLMTLSELMTWHPLSVWARPVLKINDAWYILCD